MRHIRFGVVLAFVLILTSGLAFAVDEHLNIAPEDLRIEDAPSEGGVYLYVKKTPAVQSVLITESAEREDNAVATYAFRTYAYHAENGDERRILNGAFIRPETDEGYYIIDSTPQRDEAFGRAFVLFLPYKMHFGYDDTRKGVVDLETGGAYISVRSFDSLYADYSGSYRDNSFYIEKQVFITTTSQFSEEPSEPLYDTATVDSFRSIAENYETLPTFIDENRSISDAIKERLMRVSRNESLDVVIAIDTTRSMSDDIDEIRETLVPALQEATGGIKEFRVGLVEYKDVNEIYLTRKHDFSSIIEDVDSIIQSFKLGGGKDWPEEVYAALHVAVNSFEWKADTRIVFLIGDAPAHDPPKSAVKKEEIFERARALGVQIYPFIIPKKEKS